MTRRIQFTLSRYGRTWTRANSSSRCSRRMHAYRTFVSIPRTTSWWSARRRTRADSPAGSTRPEHRSALLSQSRYSLSSVWTWTRNREGGPVRSRSGTSSFSPPPNPRERTEIRSARPLIAARASGRIGKSTTSPFSMRLWNDTSLLLEQAIDHPLHLEPTDVRVRMARVQEDDRLADRVGDGQGGAPLRVRIDLREDDPVDPDGLVELSRLLDRVVPREGGPPGPGGGRPRPLGGPGGGGGPPPCA